MKIHLQLRDGAYLASCKIVGRRLVDIVGIVDSGASVTYVTMETLKLAKLEPTGEAQRFLCVHGQSHAGIETRSYHGTITLGTGSGSGKVYAIDARLAAGDQSVGAVLGRDILRNFNVSLYWKNGIGFLE
ncbi:MAG: hypothetical protein EB833_06605 [Thaumarchaeota archaeon S13]|nr:MAG: hypothetical protein EB832_06320 [Thaumarchaeota archaeon S14]RNJ71649.1 MAG: hypothetical protein EB833_06605 [Thaumarchaeota archaeon S13]